MRYPDSSFSQTQTHSAMQPELSGTNLAAPQPSAPLVGSAFFGERFSQESALLEQKLQEAGVHPEMLMREWGVRLWSVRAKSDKIKLKLEACQPVNEIELAQWFQALFATKKPVSITISPVSKCCLSPCDGCLMGNPSKRAHWLASCSEMPKQ